MDGKKVLEVIGVYRNFFESLHIEKKNFKPTLNMPGELNALMHCHGMLDQMEQFVKEGRMDKAFRWLGFIQGCLWSAGHYTLDDLKNHSRPQPLKMRWNDE